MQIQPLYPRMQRTQYQYVSMPMVQLPLHRIASPVPCWVTGPVLCTSVTSTT